MNNSTVIALAGPTASGKTSLSILLAKKFGGEIVSADSMQIYRLLDVGTAKIRPEEMQNIPHYMIDEFMPHVNVNISLFCEHAIGYINDILSRKKIVIITGGSGLYLDSLVYASYDYSDGESYEDYRTELYHFADTHGNTSLYEKLKHIDPAYAAITHPNNVKRVVRALEYHHVTGKLKSQNVKERKFRFKNTFYFGITQDRELLYKKINERVDDMIQNGLAEEVRSLMEKGYTKDLNSMKAIGYKEIIDSFEGKMSLIDAINLIKQNSRNYAKRQLTWFKANKDIQWIDKSQFTNNDEIINFMERIIHARR